MNKKSGDLWAASSAYEKYMGRWSRRIAPQFLAWLEPTADALWLDVGCGTGVLCEAIIDVCDPISILGVDPSSAFVETARLVIEDDRFTCMQGSAESLDVNNCSFDYVVSALVLNFVANKQRAAEEMTRALKPDGKAALYVWDYAGHMQIMRYFFDAAVELDPGARQFDDGINAPVCRPKPLRQLFENAGLIDVLVDAIDIPTAFENFDDYWTPFLGGTGSAPKYYATLDAESQRALKAKVHQRIPTGPDGEVLLAARAWAVQGTKVGE